MLSRNTDHGDAREGNYLYLIFYESTFIKLLNSLI